MTLRRLAFDGVIAGVVLAITLNAPTDYARAFDGLGISLAGLTALPLLARRQAPLAVLVLVGGASAAVVWVGYIEGSAPGLLVALYSLGADPRTRTLTPTIGAVTLGLLLLHLVALNEAMEAGHAGAPLFGFFWALALVVGRGVRERRLRGSLEQRGRWSNLANEKRS
jgi:hypothetical protein